MRSIRRLDGHRSSPLLLKSLRFCSEGEIDAYHFPQESDYNFDFSESEDGEDSTSAQESLALPTFIIVFEDNAIHPTAEEEYSELEDEADGRKSLHWTDYSKFEDVEVCTSPQLSASDVDDGVSSPEPQQPFDIYECDDDELLEENNLEPQQLSTDYQSHLEVDTDQQDDESLGADSPEPRELSAIYEWDEEFDDGQQDDEPLVANSPEPQQLSPDHQSHLEFNADQQDDEPLEAKIPEPQQLSPEHQAQQLSPDHQSNLDVDDDQQDDEPVEADNSEPRQLSLDPQFHQEVDDDQQDGESLEADSPEPRELSTIYECDEEFDDGQQDDDPLESDSPEPRRLFPCRHESPVPDNDEGKDDELLEADSPEPRRLFPFRHVSPFIEHAYNEKDGGSLEAGSPEPRRLFPVDQFHSKMYDTPQPVSQTETVCPGLLRRFLTPEKIIKFNQFEDWFVRMSERKFVDTSSENPNSETPNPEPRSLVPFRHDFPVLEYHDDEKDDTSAEADSPEPRRLFPVHQFHPKMYDPPHPASQMETPFCPGLLRRFLTPEEMLKFDQLEDRFVRMSERKFFDRDAPPSRPEWQSNNGRPVLDCDDEDFEVMEYIPVESLGI